MSKKTIHIVNQAANEILLYGYIGTNKEEGEIDFESFKNDLKTLSMTGPVTLKINSGGGNMIEGLAMVDYIKSINQQVTGIVEGMAASMAGIILQACDKRIMTSNSRLMIHKAQIATGGDSDALAAALELVKQEDEKIVNILVEATGKDQEAVLEWMKPGTNKWFNAKEALAAGLIDKIQEGAKVKLPKDVTASEAVALFNKVLLPEPILEEKNTMKKPILNLLNSYKVEHKLSEESSDQEILNVVENALKDKDAVIADLNNKVELANKAKVNAAIEAAVKDGRITNENKGAWEKVLAADFENGNAALSAMTPRMDVNSMINRLGAKPEATEGDPRAKWSFNDWGKKDPKGLAKMKVENTEKYEQLLKEEYPNI